MKSSEKSDSKQVASSCPHACYASFWGRILKKWDWWIYCRAYKSLWRMCKNEPAYGYLMELQIKNWNVKQRLPESLKRSTEVFHASLMESSHKEHDEF
jgi:hypothetical protein